MRSIITVENLSKEYRIGTRGASYGTLRDSLVRAVRAPFQRSQRKKGRDLETIWALKEVNFEVKPGEVVGIIGRNGAGKSTLLKILSRIVEPSTGHVKLYGRVGSLLEVGTGFHPELSGRENIYLNGAILGMKRAEIERKFDEIVAFAEIEKFIDTAVKHYSSGMYMRLAFAVAAHLEPEILIIDEVLAVGDAAFQKKCLGKIDDVAREGRTVLFVSHNMLIINKLCSTVIALHGGKILRMGETRATVTEYMISAGASQWHKEWPDVADAPGDEYLRAVSISVLDMNRQPVGSLTQDSAFVIRIVYRVLEPMTNANVGFKLNAEDGTIVFESFDADNPEWSGVGRKPGVYTTDCLIPAQYLNEGTYYLTLRAGIPFLKLSMDTDEVLRLDISAPVTNKSSIMRMGARRFGVVAPELEWQIHYNGA
jgi:lipopolysaccharide transport system ATP-binding protein